ncbi:MAG: hypothetical protein CVU29_11320 [Betaproteobacteria bacterium HGW-Betaproteobacteria-22]|nr:MAG: hypothetical protein CVU29_11320 [Betaproteobacteria bacterium HGW-Betaproteobacteria-22]
MSSKKVTGSKLDMTEVLNCHRVPTKLYEEVKHQMYMQLKNVQPNKLYTLKKMCGKEFWNGMNSWQQRMAGRAFAHMVVVGIFPFDFIKNKSPTKRYLLK